MVVKVVRGEEVVGKDMEEFEHRSLDEEKSYVRARIQTTENLATTLWDLIGQGLAEGSSMARIRLHEDEDLYVEYFGGA